MKRITAYPARKRRPGWSRVFSPGLKSICTCLFVSVMLQFMPVIHWVYFMRVFKAFTGMAQAQCVRFRRQVV